MFHAHPQRLQGAILPNAARILSKSKLYFLLSTRRKDRFLFSLKPRSQLGGVMQKTFQHLNLGMESTV